MNPGPVSDIANGVVTGLKTQPLMLALIVLNALILAATFWSIQTQRDTEYKMTTIDQQTIQKAMDLLSQCVNPDALKGLQMK